MYELELAAAVGHAASTDRARPILCSIRFSPSDDGGVLVEATDSYVLVRRILDCPWPPGIEVVAAAKPFMAAVRTAKSVTGDDTLDPWELSLDDHAGRLIVGNRPAAVQIPIPLVGDVSPERPFPRTDSLFVTPADSWAAAKRLVRSGTRRQLADELYGRPGISLNRLVRNVDPGFEFSDEGSLVDAVLRCRKLTRKVMAAALDDHLGDTPPGSTGDNAAFNPDLIGRVAKTLGPAGGGITMQLYGRLAPAHLTSSYDPNWRALIMPMRPAA